MGDHKPSKEVPWDSYKKDKDLDAKLKRNRDFLRVKKYQRQFSRGTAPIRYRGEIPLVSTSRKYVAMRAVVSGDVKSVPFQCSVVKSFALGDRSTTNKNKVLAELPIAQQLEILKKRNKVRDVVSDDEESEEELSEEDNDIPPLKKEFSETSVKDRAGSRKSSKANVLKLDNSDSSDSSDYSDIEEEAPKEKKVVIVERRNSKPGEHFAPEKSKPKEKDKAKEAPKKKKEDYSVRKPVRLKLDTVSEEFSHVKIGKLDRMTKLMQSRDNDAPYSKRTDATRLDDVLTKWTLKAV